MLYFIRHQKNGQIEGPMTLQEIQAKILSGLKPQDYLASSDIGSSLLQLAKNRSNDWFHLFDIPELQQSAPTPPLALPKSRSLVREYAIFAFVLLLCAQRLSRHSKTDHDWFDWVTALATALVVVEMIFRFIKRGSAPARFG